MRKEIYEINIKKNIQKRIHIKERQGKPHIWITDVSKDANTLMNKIEENFPEIIRLKFISKNTGSQKI